MRRLTSILPLLACLAVLASAQTQYPPYGADPAAQPYPADSVDIQADQQHGVARISVAQGDVNVKRGDNGQLTAAVLNAPLMARDHLETAPGSRAEIQLDSANLVRLAPNTDLGFSTLEYRRYNAQLGIGTVIVRVLRSSNSQFEISTPSVALHPLAQGEYRISVFDNGTTQVTVRSGRLDMAGPNGSQTVEAGRSFLVRGDASDPEYQSSYEIPRDQFDDWSANRDGDLLSSQSYRYVSSEIGGAEDLDRSGNWVPSQYGEVWTPRAVAPEWSPYSSGRWVYEDYYGWTWIDNAPWGWAPYHYGRWFWNTGYGWCWWPGGRGLHFGWSPAQVAFFGWGGSGFGWVALAPYEIFHPWWGRGFRGFDYGRYDGFRRGENLSRLYRNASVRGGAMATWNGTFGGFDHRFGPANRGQLDSANIVSGRLPITPTQGSYHFSSRPAFENPRLAAAASRPFFSRQSAQPRGFSTAPALPRSSQSATGWQRFGSPGPSSSLRQNFSSGASEQSGWHSFGQPQSAMRSYPGAYQQPSQPRPSYNYRPAPQRFNAPPSYRSSSGGSAPHGSAPHASSAGGQSHSSGAGGGHSSGGHRGR